MLKAETLMETMLLKKIWPIWPLVILISCGAGKPSVSKQAPEHRPWTQLLRKHVDAAGMVSYEGFIEDRAALKAYLDTLAAHHPDKDSWSKDEQLAYWINTYNAFTIELILQHYPLESIKDIKRWNIPFLNTPWTIKFIKLGGKKYTLDKIEHRIIRKQFEEPRIHFALVCAAVSCPKLRREAYVAEKLDTQLQEQGRDFLSADSKNSIATDKLELSAIFNWFSGDFKTNGTLIEYIRQFTDVEIQDDANISYKDYNWQLNDQ